MRGLSICYDLFGSKPYVPLPSILYTCKSLMTLELEGQTILVDVPQTVLSPLLEDLATSIC
ncbi:BnaC06g00340D [Brassica napus]|uniref:(rape) hypothetical protein n=1 Tax=Brassica napus TaxID=3708 RepID=A0A078FVZ4_BRANA|nr:unnamed protein product [Brassica napus]CDY17101.1 BnaC06g00340D [Brassica napus]